MKVDLYKTNGSSPPNPRETVAAALEKPAINEAIQRGAHKAQVKRYASVTKSGRRGMREHTSDFVQATYLALLDNYANEYTALTPEERPRFVEQLAKRTAWHEVYPMKREVALEGNRAEGENPGPPVFACDDISLNKQNRYPDWVSAHAAESELIEHIDRQRAGTPPVTEPETTYERKCRLLGPQKANFMLDLLDYENRRYESARTTAERVRYCSLRKKLEAM
jgi:hypothetical protein